MNEKRPVNLLPNIFLILSIVALDQVTKLAILGRDVVDIYPEMEITSFLNLVLVQNKGISFGLFSRYEVGWLISILTIGIVVVLFIWMRKLERAILALPFSLIIGGAIGNLIDRLNYGFVVDFIDFHFFGWHWPAFNIADSAITVGVIFLLIASFSNNFKLFSKF
ncbi:MAG: signal peptidase II [Rickettsiales bacterium]|nr:signal peptidase II [Rickettsiales bacterium]MCH2676864.1 signal peptidase II [Alphaproteobacteria bacterium]